MRILPVNSFNLFNINTQNRYIQNSSNYNLRMSQPLMCDTVSFGENKPEQIIYENSKKIYDLVQSKNYSDALKLIKKLKPEEWNPNHVIFDDETDEAISIAERLLINKSTSKKMSEEQKKASLTLFRKVVNHPNFYIFNGEIGSDLMVSCICMDNIPQDYALTLMNTTAFASLNDDDDYRSYYEMAAGSNKNKIANALAVYILETTSYGYIGTSHGDFEEVDAVEGVNQNTKDIKLEEIQKELEEYKFNNEKSNGFADVGGMDDLKKQLREHMILPWAQKYQKVIAENNLKRPNGILLSGPTGCGKTFIISSTGKEMGCDMYEMDCGNVGSTYVHGTSTAITEVIKNLEKLYEKTGKPSILFLDEIDAIGGARQADDRGLHNEEMDVLLKLVNNCAEKGIILVGATNFPDSIDKALLRPGRIDTKIVMDYPRKREETKPIVMMYLENRPLAKDLLPYADEISDRFIGLSPALIKNVIEKSMYRAMYDNRETATMQDFDIIFEQEKKSNEEKARTPVGFKK